jgi:hypothetical protein
MNTHAILESAAAFNARHDYSLDAVLKFTEIAARHAHTVQLARTEKADPQLVLPMELPQDVLP